MVLTWTVWHAPLGETKKAVLTRTGNLSNSPVRAEQSLLFRLLPEYLRNLPGDQQVNHFSRSHKGGGSGMDGIGRRESNEDNRSREMGKQC